MSSEESIIIPKNTSQERIHEIYKQFKGQPNIKRADLCFHYALHGDVEISATDGATWSSVPLPVTCRGMPYVSHTDYGCVEIMKEKTRRRNLDK